MYNNINAAKDATLTANPPPLPHLRQRIAIPSRYPRTGSKLSI